MEHQVHVKQIYQILNLKDMINQYVREHIQYQSYTNKYLGNIKNIWFILVAPKKVK